MSNFSLPPIDPRIVQANSPNPTFGNMQPNNMNANFNTAPNNMQMPIPNTTIPFGGNQNNNIQPNMPWINPAGMPGTQMYGNPYQQGMRMGPMFQPEKDEFGWKSYAVLFTITWVAVFLIVGRWGPSIIMLPPSVIHSDKNNAFALYPGISYPRLIAMSTVSGLSAVGLAWALSSDQSWLRSKIKSSVLSINS